MGEPNDEIEQRPSETEDTARRRTRRPVKVILAVVGATVVLLGGLAVWVSLGSDTPSARLGSAELSCDATVDFDEPAPDVDAWFEACQDAKSERTSRRDTAAVIGAVAVVVAWAFSTWPSRRLTGDRLGPDPDELGHP